MPHFLSVCKAASLLVALTLLCSTASTKDALEQQKRDAVTKAIARSGQGTSHDALLAALPQTAALTAVRAGTAGEAALLLEVEGLPQVKATVSENGRQLMLELGNTVNLCSGKSLKLDKASPLKTLKSSFSASDGCISRLSLDLKQASQVWTEAYPHHFRVYVQARESAKQTVWIDILCRNVVTPDDDQTRQQLAALESRLVGLTTARGEVEKKAETLATTLSLLQKASVKAPLLRTQEELRAEKLDQQLRAVAKVDLDFGFDKIMLNAAQDESGRSFDTVPGDSDPTVNITEPFEGPREGPAPEASGPGAGRTQPMAQQELPAPAPPAAPGTPAANQPEEVPADEAPEEEPGETTAGEDAEGADGTEPPMPRVAPTAGTAEANSAIVSRMQELLEAAQPSGPVRPAADEPVIVAADGSEGTLRSTQGGDPLSRRISIDFREMDLVNVVAILASQAGINVIAGTDLQGTVTANLQDVTLRQAIETVLRTNGLGLLEEENIYRIVPYEEAIQAQRDTVMVTLENAKASEVVDVFTDILRGSPDQRLITVSANETSNIIVISGPRTRLSSLVQLAKDLDVAEPVLPTVTEPIKLNYAAPEDMVAVVEPMLTPQIGNVTADERGRFIVVKDVPVVVEQVRMLITELDRPVKQVLIDTMVVDIALDDAANTGVEWLLSAVQRQSRRDALAGNDINTGNLQDLGLGTNMPFSQNPAAALTFSLLSGDIDWTGVISAEIRNQNGRLVSNPVLLAVENTPAKISISQEIPFVELRQTSGGGSQTTTEFKEVGTILQVTPTVTHDDHIIVEIAGKESSTAGQFNGIPIEDKRELETNLRVANGQTIFVGGLRRNDSNNTVRKVPVLGNVPVVNFLFRSNQRSEIVNELLIFLTCTVVDEDAPKLTAYQQAKVDGAEREEVKVDVENNLYHDMIYPGEMRDPVWKWRRP